MTAAQRVQSILTELQLGLTPAPGVPDADWVNWLDSFKMPRFCRRCGEVMILRAGKRGRFYGCSAYPKCDYTEDE